MTIFSTSPLTPDQGSSAGLQQWLTFLRDPATGSGGRAAADARSAHALQAGITAQATSLATAAGAAIAAAEIAASRSGSPAGAFGAPSAAGGAVADSGTDAVAWVGRPVSTSGASGPAQAGSARGPGAQDAARAYQAPPALDAKALGAHAAVGELDVRRLTFVAVERVFAATDQSSRGPVETLEQTARRRRDRQRDLRDEALAQGAKRSLGDQLERAADQAARTRDTSAHAAASARAAASGRGDASAATSPAAASGALRAPVPSGAVGAVGRETATKAAAVRALLADPAATSSVSSDAAATAASDASRALARGGDRLEELREQAREAMRATAARVDSLASQIAAEDRATRRRDAREQARAADRADGIDRAVERDADRDAAQARVRRDAAAREVVRLTGAQVDVEEDGALRVSIGGRPLVDAAGAHPLHVAADGEPPAPDPAQADGPQASGDRPAPAGAPDETAERRRVVGEEVRTQEAATDRARGQERRAQAADERLLLDESRRDGDRTATDRTATDRAADDRAATDRAATERAATDRDSARVDSDRASADREATRQARDARAQAVAAHPGGAAHSADGITADPAVSAAEAVARAMRDALARIGLGAGAGSGAGRPGAGATDPSADRGLAPAPGAAGAGDGGSEPASGRVGRSLRWADGSGVHGVAGVLAGQAAAAEELVPHAQAQLRDVQAAFVASVRALAGPGGPLAGQDVAALVHPLVETAPGGTDGAGLGPSSAPTASAGGATSGASGASGASQTGATTVAATAAHASTTGSASTSTRDSLSPADVDAALDTLAGLSSAVSSLRTDAADRVLGAQRRLDVLSVVDAVLAGAPAAGRAGLVSMDLGAVTAADAGRSLSRSGQHLVSSLQALNALTASMGAVAGLALAVGPTPPTVSVLGGGGLVATPSAGAPGPGLTMTAGPGVGLAVGSAGALPAAGAVAVGGLSGGRSVGSAMGATSAGQAPGQAPGQASGSAASAGSATPGVPTSPTSPLTSSLIPAPASALTGPPAVPGGPAIAGASGADLAAPAPFGTTAPTATTAAGAASTPTPGPQSLESFGAWVPGPGVRVLTFSASATGGAPGAPAGLGAGSAGLDAPAGQAVPSIPYDADVTIRSVATAASVATATMPAGAELNAGRGFSFALVTGVGGPQAQFTSVGVGQGAALGDVAAAINASGAAASARVEQLTTATGPAQRLVVTAAETGAGSRLAIVDGLGSTRPSALGATVTLTPGADSVVDVTWDDGGGVRVIGPTTSLPGALPGVDLALRPGASTRAGDLGPHARLEVGVEPAAAWQRLETLAAGAGSVLDALAGRAAIDPSAGKALSADPAIADLAGRIRSALGLLGLTGGAAAGGTALATGGSTALAAVEPLPGVRLDREGRVGLDREAFTLAYAEDPGGVEARVQSGARELLAVARESTDPRTGVLPVRIMGEQAMLNDYSVSSAGVDERMQYRQDALGERAEAMQSLLVRLGQEQQWLGGHVG